jgi:hypothetical protein
MKFLRNFFKNIEIPLKGHKNKKGQFDKIETGKDKQ